MSASLRMFTYSLDVHIPACFIAAKLQEAVEMVKPIEDPEAAAKGLAQEAYKRGSTDNITCVVVRFLAGCGSTSQ